MTDQERDPHQDLGVRMSKPFLAAIRKAAAEEGVTAGEYIRRATIEKLASSTAKGEST